MEPDKVIGERWSVVGSAPARGGVERWRAVATDTGEPVELLTLRGRSDTQARAAFLDTHRALVDANEPGLAHTLAVVQEGRRTWVVRAPLEDATLADIEGPLPADMVAAIGARLLPAVLAAGAATQGALRDHDIGIDSAGLPVLAPRAAPLTAVARGMTRSVAPEAFLGSRPEGRAGLYGLGAQLYRLATGRQPQVGGPDGQRAPPAPPSAIRPGLPDALDSAILALMSPDPSDRPGALPALQTLARAVAPLDLRPLASAPPQAATVRYTTTATGPRATHRTEVPAAAVVIAPAELRALSAAQHSQAAGLAGVAIRTLDDLVEAGLPLVIETHRASGPARRAAEEIAARSGLPTTWQTPPTVPAWMFAVLTVVVAGVLAAAGAGLTAVGALAWAMPMWVLAAVIAMGGGVTASRASRHASDHHHTSESADLVRRDRAGAVMDGRAAPTWRRVAELRLQLADLDLPEAAATDLRGALRDVERGLEGLARVAQTTAQTLGQVDGSALRTRLAALTTRAASDPAARSERDRLARTVADIDAVEARRQGVERDLTEVIEVLDEVAGVFGLLARPDTHPDGLTQLRDTTRMVRDAISDALPGEQSPSKPRPQPVPER